MDDNTSIILPEIDRVEVITHDEGRTFTRYVMQGVVLSVQDDGTTLKIFTKEGREPNELSH